jgi:hypothetical protein
MGLKKQDNQQDHGCDWPGQDETSTKQGLLDLRRGAIRQVIRDTWMGQDGLRVREVQG